MSQNLRGEPSAERSKIPLTTQRNLWIAAAGRCEFPGCSEILWRDDVTLSEANYANIAHIVAASPDGPRGDPVRSKELIKSPENLMLLCPEHHTLIDSPEHRSEYSEQTLRGYKEETEEAVRTVFEGLCLRRTTLVTLVSKIGGSATPISKSSVVTAVFPDAPYSLIEIDYSDSANDRDSAGLGWLRDDLMERVRTGLLEKQHQGKLYPLSVFAMARIPLDIALGRALCGADVHSLYQHHRDPDDWRWLAEPGRDLTSEEGIELTIPTQIGPNAIPVVIVSISGDIPEDAVADALHRDIPIHRDAAVFKITAGKPEPHFLKYRTQLNRFGEVWGELLTAIRSMSPSVEYLPIFAAVPCPVAIRMGMLHLQADPCWWIYELRATRDGWDKAIELR